MNAYVEVYDVRIPNQPLHIFLLTLFLYMRVHLYVCVHVCVRVCVSIQQHIEAFKNSKTRWHLIADRIT